ncbi:MAG TPA: hypothetical protein VFG10_17950 [Saprospiraceae bacterium]|nr:hypothetical protein [Saprospiraceae bacterium]
MTEQSRLITIFEKPFNQVLLIAGMTIVFSLIDLIMPHHSKLLELNSGTWIVGTAMIFCFVIINTIIALRMEPILPYWSRSIVIFAGLLVFTYAWCYLLSGKHIDDSGGFSWLWIVLTMVYLVFFVIARTMKRIVDIANDQDKKLRGEE